jgi:hypothetical protein
MMMIKTITKSRRLCVLVVARMGEIWNVQRIFVLNLLGNIHLEE